MELKRLVIEFGGLCMLVQDDRVTQRLAVLLPDVKHSGMKHCPMLVFTDNTASTPTRQQAPLDGTIVDLTGLAAGQDSVPLPSPEVFARMSRYAKRSVERRWLTNASTTAGFLAARIELPLGSNITPVGRGQVVIVPDPDTGGKREVTLHGQCEVSVHVTTPGIQRITFGSTTLTPDGAGLIAVEVLHIRRNDRDGVQRAHAKGSPIPHVRAYHQLLEAGSTVDDLLVGTEIGGAPADPTDIDCATEVESVASQPARFVDVYNCIIGDGCPPGNPQC